MGKRVVKTIRCSFSEAGTDNGPVSKFLNDSLTGEIYDITVTQDRSYNDTFYYTFFYEKNEVEESTEVKPKQRKIASIKKSDRKPKLL